MFNLRLITGSGVVTSPGNGIRVGNAIGRTHEARSHDQQRTESHFLTAMANFVVESKDPDASGR